MTRENQTMLAAAGTSSSGGKIIESNFNTELANLLQRMNSEWSGPECIRAEMVGLIEGKPNARPDIMVCHPGGVPVVVETEFTPARTVEKDAKDRLGLNLIGYKYPIEQAIALKVPNQLAGIAQSSISDEIRNSDYDFCVYSLKRDELEYSYRWPESGWITGNLDDLADLIELAALSENILKLGMNILESRISNATEIFWRHYAQKPKVRTEIADALNQKEGRQTTRMAMAIVLNAIVFHKSLIGLPGVKSFEEIWKPVDENIYDKLKLFEHWSYIISNINYLPIFDIALKVLSPLDSRNFKEIFGELFDAANKLEELGTTSRHDLCGRMFQRLITDRKFLATFYTLPSSAALLAEMAIDRLDVDWSKPDKIKSLKIADFACGTGALLNASLHSILSKHRRSGGESSKIHKNLVEDVMIGTDIMPAATHLTASMLVGVYPGNRFEHTSICTLPYGEFTEKSSSIKNVSLGALDLLDGAPVLPIFDTGERKLAAIKGRETKVDMAQEYPDNSCDLVIMNPPFTRPTKHDGSNSNIPVPSFAGLEKSDEEQKLMANRLKQLRTDSTVGHGNAGLASNFFDIAHKKVKCPDGVVAMVLPSTILRGGSWNNVRKSLEKNYTDIVVFSIVSSGQTDRAFSADTRLAEILLIATRTNKVGKQTVKLVNLPRRPHSIAEAVLIARRVIGSQKESRVSLGKDLVAEISNMDSFHFGAAGIRHEHPAETARNLTCGELILPQMDKPVSLPIATLGSLGRIGTMHRNITGKNSDGTFRGPFDQMPPASKIPTYPMLWNHDAAAEKRLIVNPDSEGKIRKNCEEKAKIVWDTTKSRLHFNLEFGLTSQPLAACYTEKETIGGRAWPSVILEDPKWEIPILLWANTTFGLILFWWQANRGHLGRAMLTNSQLPLLPVLDVKKLSKKQLNKSQELFDDFKSEEFLPANETWQDPARQNLDRAVLIDLLGFESAIAGDGLELLRKQWCDEPTVNKGKSTAPMQLQ